MGEEVLKLDPAVDVVSPRDGSVVFLTPDGPFTLRDRHGLVRRISDALKAGASRSVLLKNTTSEIERIAAAELIDLLVSRGVVFTGGIISKASDNDPMRDWIRHYGGATELVALTAEVKGEGRLAEAIAAGLKGAGFKADGLGLRILAVDTPDYPRLLAMNAEAMAGGIPFLPVWLNRSCVHLGPSTVPGETACLACLLHRQQAAKWRAEPLDVALRDGVSVSASVVSVAASMVVAEALRMTLDAYVGADYGVAHQFDLVAMRLTAGKVMRLPQCAACDSASIER